MKFAVIIPYFGSFKPSIALFLEGVRRNPEIDFLFYTDCAFPAAADDIGNLKIKRSSLSDIAALATEKTGVRFAPEKPYKLCDLRAFYGLVFAEDLKGYDFWGYGDTDIIPGDLQTALAELHAEHYDKIGELGHLCFLRNTERVNRAAFTETSDTVSARDALTKQENLGFDERDFNVKCREAGLRIYDGKWAADIDIFYWRMRLANRLTYRALLRMPVKSSAKNYPHQIFALIDGRVMCVYIRRGKVCMDEYAYIHFRKEAPIRLDDVRTDHYLITREGFLPLELGTLEDSAAVMALIKQYNEPEDRLHEMLGLLVNLKRTRFGKES